MGGFFQFFGTSLGKFIGEAAITAGLDLAAAFMGGGSQRGAQLKDKTYRAGGYGHPWPRCRGTVRLQGDDIWGTNIVETTHKTVNGGIFGLGSTSTYYYTYSVSLAVGFGKKLGGGAASKFLRIFADGKILYSAVVTDASVKQPVTVPASAGGGQLVSLNLWPVGAQSIPIQTGSGASISLKAGDLFAFRWFQDSGLVAPLGTTYTVQAPVNLGPNQTGSIPVFPPIGPDPRSPDTNHSIIQIAVPGLNTPLFDQSSFDDDPHDGSHFDSTPVGPGGIRFYLGSDTQLPDPLMVKKQGVGNVPGYRGLAYAVIFNLQLANYGNHISAFSAEIAFDDATGQYPVFGPVNLGTSPALNAENPADSLLIPGSYYPNPAAITPTPPLVVAINGQFISGANGGVGRFATAYVLNSDSNSLVTSGVIPQPWWAGSVAADAECIYLITSAGFNQWAVYKIKLSSLSTVATIPATLTPFVPDPNIFEPNQQGCVIYDQFASLLGAPVLKQMLIFAGQFGSITLVDRNVGTSFIVDIGGTPATTALGSMSVVRHAETQQEGFGAPRAHVAIDSTGDIWVAQGASLTRYDGQFSTTVAINPITLSPEIVVAYPTLHVVAVYDLSASMTADAGDLFYDPGSDTLVITQNDLILRVSRSGQVLTSVVTNDGSSISPQVDAMGGILVGNGGNFSRVNVSDIGAPITPTVYTLSNWLPSIGTDGSSAAVYDPLTDSIWITDGGNLYRLYLDRAAGAGVAEDVIAAAIHDEAGYDSSQYDVSAFAPFSRQGVEFDQQPYKQSLGTLMQARLVDGAEIDAQIKYATRDRAPVITIPEDDLGATDGSKQEPRLIETLEEETTVAESVWLKYYDPLKNYQIATQYQKRISQPYASDLLDARKVVNSRTQLVISLPITDNATAIKQNADMILFDKWAARNKYGFKTAIKYIRLDPTDPIAVTYKGSTLLMRLLEADRGAGLALQFQAESYDQHVYSNPGIFSDVGVGSGDAPSGFPIITPVAPPPIDQLSATEIALAPGVAGPFSVAHLQATIPLLALIQMTSSGIMAFKSSARYDATNLNLVASDFDVTGFAALISAGTKEIVVFPTPGQPFVVPHGLAGTPALVQIQITSDGTIIGEIWFDSSQPADWNATSVYLVASDDVGVQARIIIWATLPILAGSQFAEVDIPATADDLPFSLAHGFTTVPLLVLFRQRSGGRIWLQPKGPITASAKNAGGSGYAPGDTGTILGGSADATYVVDTVTAGAVTTFHLSAVGTKYGNATGAATSVSTGGGNGAFTVNLKAGRYDSTNLYLQGSDAGVKAKALVWA